MKEKIGAVTLNYEYYDGMDYYSDGDSVEEKLLEICKDHRVGETLKESSSWPLLYHLSDIRGNIIEWYPMEKDAKVLEIGSGCGAISGFLCKKAGRVVGIELSKRRSLINAYRNYDCDNLEIIVGNLKKVRIEEKFDYITLIGVLEYAGSYVGGDNPYEQMLMQVKEYLKPNGRLIIAIENKMGLKYLNGAKEDHVGKAFAGIEDYRGVSKVRTFSKPELCQILDHVGFCDHKFYYPMPDYKLPDSIYSDEYLPGIGDIRTWGQNYSDVRIALYNEGIAFDQVCKDKMFDYFSNSFLVICNEKRNDIQYIHYTGTRNKEYQTKTIIVDEKDVIKYYLKDCARKYDIFSEMRERFETLNSEFLNVEYLEPTVEDGLLKYPYINGDSLEVRLLRKLHDVDGLIMEFKEILKTYFQISDVYILYFTITDEFIEFFGEQDIKTQEKALQVTNIDMLLQNLIVMPDKVVCIDYEWTFDFPIPFEFVVYRCAEIFYRRYQMYLMHRYSMKEFLIKIGIKEENIGVYQRMNRHFYDRITGEEKLSNYRKANGMIELKIHDI